MGKLLKHEWKMLGFKYFEKLVHFKVCVKACIFLDLEPKKSITVWPLCLSLF